MTDSEHDNVPTGRPAAGPDRSGEPARAVVVLDDHGGVGATHEERTTISAFLSARGLSVTATPHSSSRLDVSGPQADVSSALAPAAPRTEPTGTRDRAADEADLPATVRNSIVGVLGLHDRPVARKRPLVRQPRTGRVPVTPAMLIDRYRFPDSTGKGQRIGIIELAGGFDPDDLDVFFSPRPTPRIDVVEVGSGRNRPESAEDVAALLKWMTDIADGAPPGMPPDAGRSTYEVCMDVELAGAFAPDADLVVYFAENHERGLVDALDAALDPDGFRPSVLSISWGWSEEGGALEAHVDRELQRAAAAGVTVTVGSGDHGSAEVTSSSGRPIPTPEFPASSPYALACGGTSLMFSGDIISDEEVWSTDIGVSSGGGVSRQFPQPSWQLGHHVPPNPSGSQGRGVPDVAAVADPTTHCMIYAGGTWGPASGTSAAAPIWAALVARLNEALARPVGHLNPELYRLASQQPPVTFDVLSGSNGAYAAGPGWDACTGLGTPDGSAILAALRGR